MRTLVNFCWLDINGKERKVQPTLVAGTQIGAEGNQQKQKKQAEYDQCPPVFRKEFQINRGHDGVGQNTQSDGGDLNDDITGKVTVIVGAGDHQAAKSGNCQTHDKQYHIALTEKISQFPAKIAQVIAPFLA